MFVPMFVECGMRFAAVPTDGPMLVSCEKCRQAGGLINSNEAGDFDLSWAMAIMKSWKKDGRMLDDTPWQDGNEKICNVHNQHRKPEYESQMAKSANPFINRSIR